MSRYTAILVFELTLAMLLGCAGGNRVDHREEVKPEPLSLYVKSFEVQLAEIGTQTISSVTLSYVCDFRGLSSGKVSLLRQINAAEVPSTGGWPCRNQGVELFLYLYNSALIVANGGPPPRNIRVVRNDCKLHSATGVWFLNTGPAQYRNVNGEIWVRENPERTTTQSSADRISAPQEGRWMPLNSLTWPKFWRSVDERYRITSTFGE